MLRTGVASAVVHLVMLLLAQFGVGPAADWLVGAFAVGWQALLLFLLSLLAFLLWLLFGTVAIAGMGGATAVVLIAAGVTALGLADRTASADPIVARKQEEVRPVEVALVSKPENVSRAEDSEKQVESKSREQTVRKVTEQRVTSRLVDRELEGDGPRRNKPSDKGRLWTVTLPSAIVSAASPSPSDGLVRAGSQAQMSVAEASQKPDFAQQAHVARGSRETSPQGERAPSVAGVKRVFDRLAAAMPRFAEIRQHIHTPAQGASAEAARQKAIARLSENAEEGYAHAQFNLAEALLAGSGKAVDQARADELLKRAAIGGYMPAQIVLAMRQAENREDGTADIAKAHAWLSIAAAQGSPAAARARDELAQELRGRDSVRSAAEAARLKLVMAKVSTATETNTDRGKLNEQLRQAAVLGDSEALHVLLARNADADDTDREGRTPLIEAAWRGYPGIVRALVKAGAKLDSQDAGGKSALSWAAINGHAGVISELAAAGAEVDATDREGFTPLMRAAWNGHLDAVRALVRAGADPTARNRLGRNALDYARDQGNRAILLVLGESQSQ